MPVPIGGDHAADFLVGEHFVFARLVGVDDLAAQGRMAWNSRRRPPSALPPAESPSTRYSSHLSTSRAGAVAELAGQAAAGEGAFAFADQLLGLAGGFAGLGGEQAFVARSPWRPWGSLRGTCRGTRRRAELTMPSTSPLPSLVLVCAFELRLGHADGDDGGEAFAEILAAWGRGL